MNKRNGRYRYDTTYLMISMVSGLWAISTLSGLQGQTALVSPSLSGTPTLCMHLTKGAPRSSRRITSVPTRVMIRMLMAT